MILPYPLYTLFLHYKLAGSFIIYFYMNLNPLPYVFDLINELLIIVDVAIWRNLRPVFPGSESHLTLQSGKMEYSRVK